MQVEEVKLLSHVQLFVISWIVAHQASPSIGFSRQGYWSRVPLPSPIYTFRSDQISRSVVFDSF